MVNNSNLVSSLLSDDLDAILDEWLAQQVQDGLGRSDLFSEAEGREQSRRILSVLAAGLDRIPAEKIFYLQDDLWSDLRDVLTSTTRERLARGVETTEMAFFVNTLKAPLFTRLRRRLADRPEELIEEVLRVTQLIDAIAIATVEVHQKGREEVIKRQEHEMLELSTPVVQLWDGILALPLIGTLDSLRAQNVMESLLQAIVDRQAEIAILDITGVPMVDTQVAQHLLRTGAAVRLMGAECVISGISPRIAQTMVQLGVDVGGVVTHASIQNALEYAFRRVGVGIVARKRTEGAVDG